MSSIQIPPTIDTSWTNDVQAAEDAAAILKLDPAGADMALLTQLAETAGLRICLYLDRLDPIFGVAPATPPPPLRTAHANVTVELWRRKDAPFGVIEAWNPDTLRQTVPHNDPLYGSVTLVDPYKQRWGLA